MNPHRGENKEKGVIRHLYLTTQTHREACGFLFDTCIVIINQVHEYHFVFSLAKPVTERIQHQQPHLALLLFHLLQNC